MLAPIQLSECIKNASAAIDRPIDNDKINIIDRGQPHSALHSLPKGKMAVYTFVYEGVVLKIGKAGPNSNARYTSQHYNPKSAMSNLAKSILLDVEMRDKGINEDNVGEWIKQNCRRIDIEIDADLGIFTLEFIEAVLHYKYMPKYEGFSSQR